MRIISIMGIIQWGPTLQSMYILIHNMRGRHLLPHLLLVESAFHITLIYEETIRYEQSSLHMVSQTVNEYLCG